MSESHGATIELENKAGETVIFVGPSGGRADRLDAMEHRHELEETRSARTHTEQEGHGGEPKA